jgi:hypothetical protein
MAFVSFGGLAKLHREKSKSTRAQSETMTQLVDRPYLIKLLRGLRLSRRKLPRRQIGVQHRTELLPTRSTARANAGGGLIEYLVQGFCSIGDAFFDHGSYDIVTEAYNLVLFAREALAWHWNGQVRQRASWRFAFRVGQVSPCRSGGVLVGFLAGLRSSSL